MKSASFAIVAIAMVTLFGIARAQTVSDLNLFNTGTAQATATSNTNYSTTVFSTSNVDDLTASQFFFADYLRPGGSDTNVDDQLLSFTGFSDPNGIATLRFFDGDQYEPGRVATQVTIYYSTSATTGSSLNPGNYTALNSGLAFTLPISSTTSNNAYTGGTDPSGIAYDTLSNLLIPAGTKSILLDFGVERSHDGGPTTDGSDPNNYNVGSGFTSIQAFGGTAIPEPSTWALMFGGLTFLGFFARRQLA